MGNGMSKSLCKMNPRFKKITTVSEYFQIMNSIKDDELLSYDICFTEYIEKETEKAILIKIHPYEEHPDWCKYVWVAKSLCKRVYNDYYPHDCPYLSEAKEEFKDYLFIVPYWAVNRV